MTFQLSIEEGKFLVNLARQTVTTYLKSGRISHIPEDVSPKLMELYGVFVTLHHVDKEIKILRGCIGFPYPTTSLAQAVIESAVSAATQDPRFRSVSLEELDHIVFEISILSPPERVIVEKPTDYPLKIEVGLDGLIIENGYHKGLLLPQVPVELDWNEEEFLCQASMKAGLPADAWLLKATKIYRFQAIIFEEETPKGQIKLKKI